MRARRPTPPSTDTRAPRSLFESELERWRDEIDDERLRPSAAPADDADTAAATSAADGGSARSATTAPWVACQRDDLGRALRERHSGVHARASNTALALRELPPSLASRTRRCRASFSLLARSDGLMSPAPTTVDRQTHFWIGDALPAVVTFDADRRLARAPATARRVVDDDFDLPTRYDALVD
jgi:hypothetical protein